MCILTKLYTLHVYMYMYVLVMIFLSVHIVQNDMVSEVHQFFTSWLTQVNKYMYVCCVR